MQRRLRHAWRVLGTGLAFAIFGIVSIAMALVLIPFVRLTVRDREARELRAQWLIHRGFVFFIGVMETLGLARFQHAGAARLRVPGTLVVANHPTLVDVIALIAAMPQADCVVKQENFDNPFMRGMLRAAGYLPNSGGQALVAASVERLRQGRSLVLFPEGTRSPRGGLGSFQRGAAHIALAAKCDLLPVLIRCHPPTLMKGQPWYDIPERPFELRVEVGEPVRIEDVDVPGASRLRAARALTASLREVFEKGLFGAGRCES